MKIEKIDVFQVRWSPGDKPSQGSAWVRIHCEDGVSGIGEASPMLGGLASLGIITRDIAPGLLGKDPFDHAVLLDTALHRLVKLGPEGALTGALAALDIALWDVKGKLLGQPVYRRLLGGALAHGVAVLRLDRRQRRAQRGRGVACRRGAAEGPACRGQDPLRCRPHQGRCRHSRRYRQGQGGAQPGRRCVPARLRRQ